MTTKISNNINKFEKSNKRRKKAIRVIILFGMVFIAFSAILHYKSRIINIVLNSKDYGMKIKNLNVSDTLNAIDASMIIFDKDVDISIKAGTVSPDTESGSSKLKDITATLIFKKDKRQFLTRSLHGSIKTNKTISLYPNPTIFDEDGNSANFTNILFNSQNGEITGKLPIINGEKNNYKYNITGSSALYGKKMGEIDIFGPVLIKAKNTITKEETRSFSESGVIIIEKRILSLRKNVKIEHLSYIITSDLVDVLFFNSQEIEQNKQHKMFSSDVEKVDMYGNVYLFDKVQDIKIWSDLSQYSGKTGEIIFSQNVKVLQMGKKIIANTVTYNLNTQKFTIQSGSNVSSTGQKSSKSDIKIIFN